MRARACGPLLLLVTALGCGDEARTLSWRYSFASSALEARAVRLEATVTEGACAGTVAPLWREELAAGSAATMAPPELGPGTYALRLRARDGDCIWFAAGCEEVTLPRGEGETVVVELVPLTPEAPQCPAAACVDGRCAGADGGAEDGGLDAGPVDGGPTDAGPLDGGPLDAATDGGAGGDAGPAPTGCDDVHLAAAFCDGFESGDFSRWDTNSTLAGGTLSIVTDPGVVYRGGASLHARAPGPSGRASLREDQIFPSSVPSDVYVRSYVMIPNGFTVIGADFLHLEASGPSTAFVNFHLGGGEAQLYADIPDPDEVLFGPLFPRASWVCVEMRVRVHPTAGSITMWLDGTTYGPVSGIDTDAGSALGTLLLGINYIEASETETLEAYFDEVVVSTSRVGCD